MKKILLCAVTAITISAYGTTFEVGPGKTYSSISATSPWNKNAGDTIKIYYKSTPYYEKFLLEGAGSPSNPIVVIGIPDINGNRPILDGTNAVNSSSDPGWNEDRQIIKVGQNGTANNIIIEGLEFRNANANKTWTKGSSTTSYLDNACGIRSESMAVGGKITIRNCVIHDCGNGIQNGSGPQEVLIEKCHIYNNGASGTSSSQEHNVYINVGGAGSKVIIQYCRFGGLLNDGQNIKSRCETNIIRYNWIEGGPNGQLDLVEGTGNAANSNSYVYGNVIIKPTTASNNRSIHWGRDGGGTPSGILYFFNNTCTHAAGGRIFDLSYASRTVAADNNIFYTTTGVSLYSANNVITGSNNWVHSSITGTSGLSSSITGTDPKFISASTPDFHLLSGSPCIDVLTSYTEPGGYSLEKQYVSNLSSESRTIVNSKLDLGAYEYGITSSIKENNLVNNFQVFPNPSNGQLTLIYSLQIQSDLTIEIGDITGKTIRSAAIFNQTPGEYIQQTAIAENLSRGVYFISIKTVKDVLVKKIIIE